MSAIDNVSHAEEPWLDVRLMKASGDNISIPQAVACESTWAGQEISTFEAKSSAEQCRRKLSNKEINRLLSIAGDHSKPEKEWMRACFLLGHYKHRRRKKASGMTYGVLAFILFGSAFSIFMHAHHYQSSQIKPPAVTPNVTNASEASDVNLFPYMDNVQRKIKMDWSPPLSNVPKQVVVVQFKLLRDGTIHDARVTQSADLEQNKAALKALEQAAPFDPLPTGSPAEVKVQFTFTINNPRNAPVLTATMETLKLSPSQKKHATVRMKGLRAQARVSTSSK